MKMDIMNLSEICSVNGDRIMPGIDTGTHDTDYYTSTVDQPKQQKPNNSSLNCGSKY
jgi:hypothetical protein